MALEFIGFVAVALTVLYAGQGVRLQTESSKQTIKEKTFSYLDESREELSSSLGELYSGNILSLEDKPEKVMQISNLRRGCIRLMNNLEMMALRIDSGIYDKKLIDQTLNPIFSEKVSALTVCVDGLLQHDNDAFPLLRKMMTRKRYEHNK